MPTIRRAGLDFDKSGHAKSTAVVHVEYDTLTDAAEFLARLQVDVDNHNKRGEPGPPHAPWVEAARKQEACAEQARRRAEERDHPGTYTVVNVDNAMEGILAEVARASACQEHNCTIPSHDGRYTVDGIGGYITGQLAQLPKVFAKNQRAILVHIAAAAVTVIGSMDRLATQEQQAAKSGK